MSLTDWNWRLPVDLQDTPWDCAACSTAWAMRTVGYPHTEQDVIAGLGPSRISPSLGLLDASGAGLVEYLGEVGITAQNNPSATFQEVFDAAGFQPMVMGGRNWCHWVGLRLGGRSIGRDDLRLLALMNSAPGYMGIDQVIDESAFYSLGGFSAVWFTSW